MVTCFLHWILFLLCNSQWVLLGTVHVCRDLFWAAVFQCALCQPNRCTKGLPSAITRQWTVPCSTITLWSCSYQNIQMVDLMQNRVPFALLSTSDFCWFLKLILIGHELNVNGLTYMHRVMAEIVETVFTEKQSFSAFVISNPILNMSIRISTVF